MSDIKDFEVNTDLFEVVTNDTIASLEAKADGKLEDDKGDTDQSSDSEDMEDDSDLEEEEEGEDSESEEDSDDEDEEDEDSEDEDGDSDGKEAQTAQAPETKPKKIKLTLADGTQVDADTATSLKLKVDGKYQRVTIAELTSDYNGKIKSDELIRRNSELQKEAKQVLADTEARNEELKRVNSNMLAALTKGDLLEAIALLPGITEEKADEMLQGVIEGMTNFVEEFSGLTQAERNSKVERFRTQQELARLKKERDDMKSSKDREAKEAAIEKACETNGIDREHFDMALQASINWNARLKEAGHPEQPITVNSVIALHYEFEDDKSIRAEAEELGVTLEDSDVDYLVSLAAAERKKKGSGLSEKDYIRLIRLLHKKETEKLSRKVGASTAKTTPKSKKKTKEKDITRIEQIWGDV